METEERITKEKEVVHDSANDFAVLRDITAGRKVKG